MCVVQAIWETDTGRQLPLSAFRQQYKKTSSYCWVLLRESEQSQGTMKMKRTLGRISCLVTLLVELSWINVGHSLHREGGSRVSVRLNSTVTYEGSCNSLFLVADVQHDDRLCSCQSYFPHFTLFLCCLASFLFNHCLLNLILASRAASAVHTQVLTVSSLSALAWL